ncbi:proline-rich protein 36-like [Arapaima gigas]
MQRLNSIWVVWVKMKELLRGQRSSSAALYPRLLQQQQVHRGNNLAQELILTHRPPEGHGRGAPAGRRTSPHLGREGEARRGELRSRQREDAELQMVVETDGPPGSERRQICRGNAPRAAEDSPGDDGQPGEARLVPHGAALHLDTLNRGASRRRLRKYKGLQKPHGGSKVVAQVRQAYRGKKHRGGSIGRAFSWLKGKRKRRKRKKGSSSLQNRGGRPDDGLQQSHDPNKAVPRQEDKDRLAGQFTVLHFQENVFEESSRPQYLLDLHSEAQEGLKILQQEEKENGIDFQDDQSISSTVTLQPEEQAIFGDGTSVDSRSVAADTVSMVSGRSIRSTQSAFTRKGSTFRPLNQGKHEGERPWRKDRRTTVVGIPQHIQKELGLDRVAWLPHMVDGQLPNGGNMVIADGENPTSSQQEQNVHLEAFKALQVSGAEQQLKQHIEAMYRDGPRPSPLLKHRLLATPANMEGILQTPPSPVMTISPQASYLSKIIPNAVMPADVDVVEITRSRSRSSMRTLSKSSLVTASPAPSRASERYSSYNRYELSSRGSTWSRSDSSDTIVSSSSTISSQGGGSTPRVNRKGLGDAGGTERNGRKVQEQFSVTSSVSGMSVSLMANGKVKAKRGDETEGLRKDHFVRSKSVTKTKRPPPPPCRSNSLHQDKFKHQKENRAKQAGMQKNTLYPFGGTSTKGDKHNITELPRTLLPSATLSPVCRETQANGVQLPFAATVTAPSNRVTSPTAAIVLRELFDIPEPPKVAAPLSPPPETWIHNRRTLSLLCGLGANRSGAPKRKQQKRDSLAARKEEPVGNGKRAPLSGTECKGDSVSTQSATESVAHIRAGKTLEDPAMLKKDQSSPVVWKKEEASPVVQKKELAPVGKKSSPVVKKEEPEQAQASPRIRGKRIFFLGAQKKVKASPEVQKKEPKGSGDKVTESPLAQQMKMVLPTPDDRLPAAPLTHAPPGKRMPTSSVSSLPSPPPMEELPAPVFEVQDEPDILPPPLFTPSLEEVAKTTSSVLVPSAVGTTAKSIITSWTVPPIPEDIPPPPQQAPPPPPASMPPALPLNVLPEGIPPPPQQAPPPPPVTVAPAPPLNVQPEGISSPPRQDSAPTSVTIPPAPPINVPPAPSLPVHDKSSTSSGQESSAAPGEGKEKKPLLHSKSTPFPKEDTILPVVTPSLLHMIRLRSVHNARGLKSARGQNTTDHEEEPQKAIQPPPSGTLSPPTVTTSPPSAASSPPKLTSVQLNVSTSHTETAMLPAVIHVTSTPTQTPTVHTVTTAPPAAKPAPPSTSESGIPAVDPPAVVTTPPAPKPTLKFASTGAAPVFKITPVPPVVTKPQPSSEATPRITLSTAATLSAVTSTPSSTTATLSTTSPVATTTQSTTTPAETATSTATVAVSTTTTLTASVSTTMFPGTPTPTASLSTSTTPATATPSMRLQEAIRMKAAAMSRDGPAARCPRTSLSSSPRSPEAGDLHKSPASTASFIFSKKGMEMPSSANIQSDLRKNLVTEGQLRSTKVPPPVSKKPISHLPSSSDKPVSSEEQEPLAGPQP